MRVYCVKLHNKRAPRLSSKFITGENKVKFFPFERFYLWNVADKEHIRAYWRNAIVVPVNTDLLNVMWWYTSGHKTLMHEMTASMTDWLIVAPIYAKYDAKLKRHVIQYNFSRLLKEGHNPDNLLDGLYIVTQERELPGLCCVCSHMCDFYNGDCSPGNFMCARKIDTHIPQMEDTGEQWVPSDGDYTDRSGPSLPETL